MEFINYALRIPTAAANASIIDDRNRCLKSYRHLSTISSHYDNDAHALSSLHLRYAIVHRIIHLEMHEHEPLPLPLLANRF
jgi:hypothetical protein